MGTQATKEEQLRKRILEIQQDDTLNSNEKAKGIQSLFNKVPIEHEKNICEGRSAEPKVSYHNEEALILGCEHYPRRAKIQAVCCAGWFTCRFCHDDASDHPIDRKLTQKMCCMVCFQEQPVAKSCQSCHEEMASYYCEVCRLWDDSPNKNFYHCDGCGICRVGKGLGIDYQHCEKCAVCLSVSMFKDHRCIENNSKSDCPICGEFLFTSRKRVVFMPCEHMIHASCHRRLLAESYQCPICSKSLGDMTEIFTRLDQYLANPFPEEFANKRQYIFCCDCEQRSVAKYHFIYHKCGHCGSYSTKILDTFEADDPDYLHLGEIPRPVTYTYIQPPYLSNISSVSQPSDSPNSSGTSASEQETMSDSESTDMISDTDPSSSDSEASQPSIPEQQP